VAATGKSIIVPDVTRDPRHFPGIPGGQSEIAVPLLARGRIIGVLAVESPRLNAFDRRDEQILTNAATSIAIAIDSARRFEEIKQKRDRYELLLHFAKTVSEARDLEQALQIVAESLMRGCPATLCCMLIRTRDGEAFQVRY